MEAVKRVKGDFVRLYYLIIDPFVRLYYYLVRKICVFLHWFKRADGTPLITPNIITISRVVIFIPLAIYFSLRGEILATIISLICSYVGDTIDGEYARMYGMITSLGAWLDRFCDKAGNLTVIFSICFFRLISLVNDNGALYYALVIMSLIEGFALWSSSLEWTKSGLGPPIDMAAKGIGKAKMTLQSITLVFLFATELGISINPLPITLVLMAISGLAIASLAGHLKKWKNKVDF